MANYESKNTNSTSNQKPPQQKPAMKKDESLSRKAGDAMERVGEKLKGAGAEKLGSAVYKAGNKLEHSGEKK